jgi:hypothetical protein
MDAAGEEGSFEQFARFCRFRGRISGHVGGML